MTHRRPTLPNSPTAVDARTTADLDTIGRARDGDIDALAELWAIYQPQVLRLLRSRGASSAEDVASQVWLEAGARLDRFEGDGDAFRGWLFALAGRRSIDEARRVARRTAALERSRAVRPVDGETDVADEVARSLDSALDLLAQLQPDAAEVVLLRVVHDLPVAEVARLTGRTESHVRVTVHRALGRLRDAVDNGDVEVAVP